MRPTNNLQQILLSVENFDFDSLSLQRIEWMETICLQQKHQTKTGTLLISDSIYNKIKHISFEHFLSISTFSSAGIKCTRAWENGNVCGKIRLFCEFVWTARDKSNERLHKTILWFIISECDGNTETFMTEKSLFPPHLTHPTNFHSFLDDDTISDIVCGGAARASVWRARPVCASACNFLCKTQSLCHGLWLNIQRSDVQCSTPDDAPKDEIFEKRDVGHELGDAHRTYFFFCKELKLSYRSRKSFPFLRSARN